jgi:chromate transport protein ChrA
MLVSYRLRGWSGILACVGGLLLPSAILTVLMTAGYTIVRSIPAVQAVMKGMMPATIGLSLAVAVQMGQPSFLRSACNLSSITDEHF